MALTQDEINNIVGYMQPKQRQSSGATGRWNNTPQIPWMALGTAGALAEPTPIGEIIMAAILANQARQGLQNFRTPEMPNLSSLFPQAQRQPTTLSFPMTQRQPTLQTFPSYERLPYKMEFPAFEQEPTKYEFPMAEQKPSLEMSQPTGEGKVEYVKPDTKYPLRKSNNIEGDSFFHETSPERVRDLMGGEGAGLNVSNDPLYALGQGGKGVIVEFDKKATMGDRGIARIIKKPSTRFVGEKEFELGLGTNLNPKSITIKSGVKVDMFLKRLLHNGQWDLVKLEDGSLKATRKALSQPTGGRTNIHYRMD